MLNQATMDMLTAMKMTAMAAEFANQLKDPTFNELGFEERLGLLVNAEWNRRQSNKLNRFIRNARFAVPSATVEGIEYYEDRKLDKAQILRFATGQYIDEGHHIILKGASGNGKTYIACDRVLEGDGISSPVHLHGVPRLVLDAHGCRCNACPTAVTFTKLSAHVRSLARLLTLRAVFFP